MTDLVLTMVCRRPESTLDSASTAVCETGEGWRQTGEMGGRRRRISWRAGEAWEIPLGKARAAFPDPIFPEGQEVRVHPARRNSEGRIVFEKHWTSLGTRRTQSYWHQMGCYQGWKWKGYHWSPRVMSHAGTIHPRMRREKVELRRAVFSTYAVSPDYVRTHTLIPHRGRYTGYTGALHRISVHHRPTEISAASLFRRIQKAHPLPLADASYKWKREVSDQPLCLSLCQFRFGPHRHR